MDINWLFDGFYREISIGLLLALLITFLLGILFGFFRWATQLKRLRKALQEKENELGQMRDERDSLKEQYDLLSADLKRTEYEAENLRTSLQQAEEANQTVKADLFTLNEHLGQLQSANDSYAATVEDLNNQIIGLKTQHQQLLEDAQSNRSVPALGLLTTSAGDDRLTALEERLGRVDSENAALRAELSKVLELLSKQEENNAAIAKLAAAEHALEAAESEKQELLLRIESLESEEHLPSTETERGLSEPETQAVAATISEEAEAAALSALLGADKAVLREKILPPDQRRDDLSRISGIGPFLERRLNEIGVYTFDEISQWDSERIAEVTAAIGYFPGRIEKDNWVGQAAALQRLAIEDPGAITGKDDLKVVEGIGPKIEALLQDKGIFTWQALSDTPVERLREILHDAGSAYRIHDPSTWPEQARLAASGEWEALKELKDQLLGGREVK